MLSLNEKMQKRSSCTPPPTCCKLSAPSLWRFFMGHTFGNITPSIGLTKETPNASFKVSSQDAPLVRSCATSPSPELAQLESALIQAYEDSKKGFDNEANQKEYLRLDGVIRVLRKKALFYGASGMAMLGGAFLSAIITVAKIEENVPVGQNICFVFLFVILLVLFSTRHIKTEDLLYKKLDQRRFVSPCSSQKANNLSSLISSLVKHPKLNLSLKPLLVDLFKKAHRQEGTYEAWLALEPRLKILLQEYNIEDMVQSLDKPENLQEGVSSPTPVESKKESVVSIIH